MLLIVTVLVSCVTTQPPVSTEALLGVPLPPLAALGCCWQSEERVTLHHEDRKFVFLTIIARQPHLLTVVVFDGLGHRQLTVTRDDNGTRLLTEPTNWDSRISNMMLVGIFLHHHATGPWLDGDSELGVTRTGQRKVLRSVDHKLASLDYLEGEPGDTRRFRIAGQPLVLEITTLNHSPL